MQEKIVIWSLINCVFPICPVPLIWLGFWYSAKETLVEEPQKQGDNKVKKKSSFKPWKTIVSLLSDGQLFFYCASLVAGTISDLTFAKGRNNLAFAILICIMVGVTFIYGQIVRIKVEQESNIDAQKKTTWSSVLISIAVTVYIIYVRQKGGLFE